ncbi:hypothetical protein DFH09DRAFT_1334853 [Mycena vulgaris]|nr:hypothetical protein DFH09DRAFT_1334853 [Mycena vulgaris]
MARQKRARKRIAKEDLKNLRLWAEGVREEVLRPHIDGYAVALDAGWREERAYWKKVCVEFHACVHWRTEDHEEPIIAKFDPMAVVPKEILSAEDAAKKIARVAELDARIRRWFLYRIRHLRKHRRSAVLDPSKDPYAILLSKLTGMKKPTKARQGFQQYMRESYSEKIAPLVASRWAERREKDGESRKEPKAGFRAEIARELFAALPSEERKAISGRVQEEAASQKAAYVKQLTDGPSTAPADRQECIDNIGDFMGPILRGIQEHTGCHALLLLGGPMPKYGGDLRTVNVSVGRNHTASAAYFPQWDKAQFSENVVKFMTEYLHTAYSE